MKWFLIGKVVVALFGLAGAWSVLKRRPDWLLFLFVTGSGFMGFYFPAGTNWTAAKVVGVWLIIYVVFLDHRWMRRLKGLNGDLWWALVFWVLIASALAYVVEAPIKDESYGLQGPALRPLVQLYAYLSSLAIVPLALCVLTSEHMRRRFLDVYAAAGLVLCAGGVVQLASFQLGFDFMPIVRLDGSEQTAQFYYGGEVVKRIYSFSGEPKGLSAFLLPLFFVALVGAVERQRFGRWWSRWWFVCLVGGILLSTYSTSALLAMVIGGAFLGIVVGGFGRKLLLAGIFVSAAFLVVTASEDTLVGDSASDFVSTMRFRTVDRLGDTIDERLETKGLAYVWNDRPDCLAAGLGLGMYTYHIAGLRHSFGIEPIDSGWVTNLLDLGFVGLLLIVAFLGSVLRTALKLMAYIKGVNRVVIACAVAGLLGAAALHAGTGAFTFLMIWSGLVIATEKSMLPLQRRLLALDNSVMRIDSRNDF